MLRPNANTSSMLEKAIQLTEWMGDNVPERNIPDSFKTRVAGTCFTIARNHQAAIVHLIDTNLYSPAFSLARTVYEGYIRGAWMLHCATEGQADKYLDSDEIRVDGGTKKLKIDDLINELEATPAFDKDALMHIQKTAWNALNDYAHVGGRLVNHWNADKSIEVNFSSAEIDEVLSLTAIFAVLACTGMVELAQVPSDDELMEKLLEQVKVFGSQQ